jgi:hypothetical protein
MNKLMEIFGVSFGIVGSFLLAFKLPTGAIPLFFVSSIILFLTAIRFRQYNLAFLQASFLIANSIAIVNWNF